MNNHEHIAQLHSCLHLPNSNARNGKSFPTILHCYCVAELDKSGIDGLNGLYGNVLLKLGAGLGVYLGEHTLLHIRVFGFQWSLSIL